MAALICWASGMLEVVLNKNVPETGPVVLMKDVDSRVRSAMLTHGEWRNVYDPVRQLGWYVPGTKPPSAELDDSPAAVSAQRDNMALVIAFAKKIHGLDADGA